MSPVSAAFARFDAAYSAMLTAAADVRRAVAEEAGVKCDDPCALIIGIVARHYGFTPEEMVSARRYRDLAQARHVAMWICRTITPLSLPRIGAAFRKDHGTVIWAIESVGDHSTTQPRFASELLDLRHRCEQALSGVAGSASDPKSP